MILLIIAGIVALGTLVSLGAILLVKLLIPHYVTGWEKNSSSVFAFAGTLYALVVGFVLAFALQGYQETSADAGAEANSVRALSRAATLFDADSRDRIGHELICYARAVIDEEWPLMAGGDRSELAGAANDRLFQTFGRLGRTNSTNAALSSSLDRVRELGQARASRLQASSEDLPLIFWLFLIGGGLIICLFAAIVIGRERFLMQFIYLLPLAMLLISSIYLVYTFEQPYSGTNAIEPTSMEIALESVVDFVPDPRADRPCP